MTDAGPRDLTEAFEASRGRLRAVAYRMLGSLSEAEDAVQEAWLRLSRADDRRIENLGGWLTTVVGRICLDMLRSRRSAARSRSDDHLPEPVVSADASDPSTRRCWPTRSASRCWWCWTLSPAERLAFVLHDMFAVPFDEIAPIVGRSPGRAARCSPAAPGGGCAAPAAAHGRRPRPAAGRSTPSWPPPAAATSTALLAVLDPDVVVRIDLGALARWRAARGPRRRPRGRAGGQLPGLRPVRARRIGQRVRRDRHHPRRRAARLGLWHSRSPQARSSRSTSWPTAPG